MDQLAPNDAFHAPIVDVLKVRVLVDSFYERFLPPASHQHVEIEHVRQIPGRQMTTLACEWGLSLHLESHVHHESAQYLVDFGYTPEIINRNFDLLGIEPGKIKGLILSHAHRDHFGGLAGFVDQYRDVMREDISLYVGGEEAFREKWIGKKEKPVSWGHVDRDHLDEKGVCSVCCSKPLSLGQVFTSGYIKRQTFECVTGGSMVEDKYDHFTNAERQGALVKDEHPDEHAACYIIRNKGLVVITSCGHVGLINTVKTAMHVSGVTKLHAVIGGFHLGTATPDYISHTVDELQLLNPDVILPMHCSGSGFIDAVRQRLPEKLVTSNVGSRFTFKSQ